MNVGATLKNVGLAVCGLLVMAALVGLGIIVIGGATVASLWVIKWVPMVFWGSLAVAVFILGPLSLIPITRVIAATGFVIASFIFGTMMWCWGLAFTYEVWGTIGVIIGLVIAGVGIVPVAILAALLHGEWQVLIVFVIFIVLTFGLRALGLWLGRKVDEKAARLASRSSVASLI
jgi:hypothetical protein